MFSNFLVALLALSPLAYAGNFMLMEKVSGGENQLFITQSSVQPPGCNEKDNAQTVAGNNVFVNKEDFSGSACGVELNFYWDGKQYNYFQNEGSGQSLGWCGLKNMSPGCRAQYSYGVAWCQNYDETVNGVNPCVN